MKTFHRFVLLAFALSACSQSCGGGIGSVPGGIAVPGMSGPASGVSEGIAEPSLDTPPIAGPSVSDDPKPEHPYGVCGDELGGDQDCPGILEVSRTLLCTRTDTRLNPAVTGSQTVVFSPTPLTSGGFVAFKLWRHLGDGSPSDSVDVPLSDLSLKGADADPEAPGVQIAADPDGTVTFRLVAGERTGSYEFWVYGDLDTARGMVWVKDCSEPDPPPSSIGR